MSAHAYWRVHLKHAGQNAALAEVQMRVAVGGASVATGGTPFATPALSGDASTLFDGVATGAYWLPVSLWSSAAGYRFASPVEIVEIALSTASVGSLVPASATLQWSDDGQHWLSMAPACSLEGVGADSTVVFSGFTAAAAGAGGAGLRARMADRWPAAQPCNARGSRARFDSVDSGPGRIAGDVAIEGPPLTMIGRRVRLFSKLDGRLVRETFSDPITGAYAFEGIALRTYFVVTEDHTAFFNAVIADRITPEV